MTQLGLILKTMRPRQWVKNVLLLAGLYFPDPGGSGPLLLNPQALQRAILGFLVFCSLAGAIYLLNDTIDAPRDRLHPKKKNRPIAAGELSPVVAIIASMIFGIGGLAAAYLLWWPSRAFGLCATAYFGMELFYAVFLKEVFLIDAIIISMGFMIRAVSGIIVLRTAQLAVPLTPWFVVCVLFLSLLLAFCKRRGELAELEADAPAFRSVLEHYSEKVLDAAIGVCATASILAYALYAVEHERPWNILSTLPFVIFGVFRYLHLVYDGGHGSEPEEVFLKDPTLLGCVGLWAVALLLVFY